MQVGAVIVTYNPQIEDLKKLFSNITQSVCKIVIVDNGSNNLPAIIELANTIINTDVILLNENLGIGVAQNQGIQKLFNSTTAEAVILFDHDSHPDLDMIDILKKGLENLLQKHSKIGAVGPIFMDPRTKNNYPISLFKGFRLLKKYPIPNDDNPIYASFLIASGSLIPKATLEAVGYMNEAFFIDYIDIEWSFRATSMGFPSYAIPNAKMYHQVGDDRLKILGREISIHSPVRRYYLARNSILMMKEKHISWEYKVREFYYTLTRIFVYIAVVKNRMKYIKYIAIGMYDGVLNKTGKCKIKA